MELHEAENQLWAMLDRQDAELRALYEQLQGEDFPRLWRAYLRGVVKTRIRVTQAVTMAYVDEKEEQS